MRESRWGRKLVCFALMGMSFCLRLPGADFPTFKPLFDGQDLDGWVLPDGPDAANFVVRNGAIAIKGQSGWLHTRDTFQNFTLKASVRFLKTEQLGNSGIFMR